jgi:glutaminase
MDTQEQLLIRDLRETDIFAGLSNLDLEQMAEICDLRTYQANERCVVRGEAADELGIVNEGKFQIEIPLEVPPYTQTLNVCTLTKGNSFAWSALVERHLLTASVRCLERGRAFHIKTSELQRIFRDRPSVEHVVMRNLATIMSSRLRESWGQLTRLVAEMIKQGK